MIRALKALQAWPARSHLGLISTAALFTLWSSVCLADEITPHSQVPPILPQVLKEEIQFMQEEIVTIAVRHEQPISEAPSNVYVITDQDIRQSGATDIPTLLRRIPGMEVMQVTGSEINVAVRGDNQLFANKLLVLVDGRSIYEDTNGTVFWKLIPVTLPEIKRIEVLKGPASVVYGFNAFDGVVDIITKSPEEMKGTTLQFGGGEFGTVSSAAVHAGARGNLGYRLSAGWDQNQQWRNRDALGFRKYKFNLHGEYGLAESKLLVSGGLADSNHFDSLSVTTISETTPAQAYVNVAYERPAFFVHAWWSEGKSTGVAKTHPLLSNLLQTGLDRGLNRRQKWRGNTYNIEAQHSVEPSSTHRLTYGVNYRHNTTSYNLISAFSREDRLGLYLQDEWHASQALSAVAGLRLDLHSEINPTYSPRAAFIYRAAPDHTFRATISVAYRPPTLLETNLDVRTVLMLPPPFPSPPPISTVGSSNLDPEQIISYDVGYQGWFFRHRLRLRADLFFNHHSDLINFSDAGPALNAGEADIYGGEAGIEFLVTPWLSGFANYAYQEVGQTITGINRRAVPRFKVNGGLRGEWLNGLSGEASLHYVSAITFPTISVFADLAPLGAIVPNPRVGGYTLLNLRGGYRFWNEKAELAVSVFNALNDKHKEHPLGATIRSRVMGWLTITL